MSTFQACTVVSMVCGQNLSGDQYEALHINTSGQVVKQTTTDHIVCGILAENPGTTAAGDRVLIALIAAGGIMKGKAGGAITAGQILIPDTTDGRIAGIGGIGGLGVDHMAFGIALEAAADGQIFSFLAMPIGGPHSA